MARLCANKRVQGVWGCKTTRAESLVLSSIVVLVSSLSFCSIYAELAKPSTLTYKHVIPYFFPGLQGVKVRLSEFYKKAKDKFAAPVLTASPRINVVLPSPSDLTNSAFLGGVCIAKNYKVPSGVNQYCFFYPRPLALGSLRNQ